MNKTTLSYQEKAAALSIRIHAHRAYSNFSLEECIERNIAFKKGAKILDIGCGNGNLFPVFSKKIGKTGTIVGIDQSEELLRSAQSKKVLPNLLLMKWDMNNTFPFIEESFDYVTSFFSIYYADNANTVVEEIKRVLKEQGRFIFVGPTDNNARELYEFNRSIFGFGRYDKADARTSRLENEIYNELKNVFGSCEIAKIPSKLIFPDKMEFVKYYTATLLFEESSKEAGYLPEFEKLIEAVAALEISKEMIMLQGGING